jgi:hypothetical protein
LKSLFQMWMNQLPEAKRPRSRLTRSISPLNHHIGPHQLFTWPEKKIWQRGNMI